MRQLKMIVLIGISLALAAVVVLAQEDTGVIDARIDAALFRPVEDIIDGEILVTEFAPDGTATVRLTTDVAVACSIVYGTTLDFGHLSLDMDMAGGTHSDHHPLLLDLEPDTLYYYRVQGVDDNGVIYLSEMMTFTTPPKVETVNENLASAERGATIMDVSSNFGGAANDENWGALKAFDSNPNTAWSSDGDGDNAWIEVELAERSRIDRVEFWTRFMTNGTAQIFEFMITTDEGEVYGPFELPDPDQAYEFEVDIVAKRLRFEVMSSNGGNTGAVEIAVYGDPVDEDGG